MGGNNSLYGGSGNDTIYSGKNDDFIDGGTGVDTVSYEDINTGGVTVYLGKESISQNTINAGNDTLKNIQNVIGSNNKDIIAGNSQNNSLFGGLGDDTFIGSGGNDTLDGGDGIDVASYANATDDLNIDLGSTSVYINATYGTDTFISIEGAIGGSGNDTIKGTSGSNVLIGGAGDDTLLPNGNDGNDELDYIDGGTGTDFVRFYEICKKYDAGGVALTGTQNFVVYDVKDEVVQSLADEFEELGYPYTPNPFRARLQSCTGKEFCKFGITETKEFAKKVVVELENRFPDFKEDLTIAISGCGNTCSQPQIADIGFVGAMIRHEGERVEGYDVLLGGNLEGTSKSRIARKIGVKVPSTGVVDYIEKLINDYKTDNLGQERFKDYLAVLQPVGSVEDSE
jgi:hypothetical protein